MTRELGIRIRGDVDLNVEDAKRKVRELNNPDGGVLGGPALHAGMKPQGMTADQVERTVTRLLDRIGGNLSTARTDGDHRRLADAIARAEYYARAGVDDKTLARLTEIRDAVKQADVSRNAAPAPAGGSGSAPPPPRVPLPTPAAPGGEGQGAGSMLEKLLKMVQERGAANTTGMLSSLLGRNMGSLAGGLLGKFGWIGAALSAPSMINSALERGYGLLKGQNSVAREEIVGMADLGRQYGYSGNMFMNFRNSFGWTNDRFARYGYTATEAARVASALDQPGGMMNDTESVLRFSRATGMDEMRTASLAKALPNFRADGQRGGNASEALRITKLAMTEGVRDGIAQSTTMQNILNFAQQNASEGRSTNATSLAWFAGLTGRLNDIKNGSNVFSGQNGASMLANITNGIATPSDPGLEYLLLNTVGAPSSKALGMHGDEARGYDAIRKSSPLQAGRYILDRIKSGKNPAMFQQVLEQVDSSAGGNGALQAQLYEQYFGLSKEQAVRAIGNGGLSKMLKQDPQAFQRYLQGENLSQDVQGGNRTASQTREMQRLESERQMVDSLANLKRGGWLEEKLSGLLTASSDIRAMLFDTLNPGAAGSAGDNMGGTSGQFYTPPGVTGGAGVPPRPAGSDNRIAAAVAAVESTNGANANMNAGNASGIYQVLPKNVTGGWGKNPASVTGKGGWDSEFLGYEAKNPDGSLVRTDDQARKWLRSHPEEANRMAEGQIRKIEKMVVDQFKKEGISNPSPDHVAGLVAALWHENGGATLAPVMKAGKIAKNAAELSTKVNGDVSPQQQYNKAVKAYQSAETQAPNTSANAGDAPRWSLQGVAASGSMTFTQDFGANPGKHKYGSKGHTGWDFAVGTSGKGGEPVGSPTDGNVVAVGYEDGGYGNYVKIRRRDGYSVILGHLMDKSIRVKQGDVVTAGQIIGAEGKTGNADGYHVHVEVRNPAGQSVNPAKVFQNYNGMPMRSNIRGFASGGYTGHGNPQEIAGVVHGQEWVFDAATTRRHRRLFERLSSGGDVSGAQVNVGDVHVSVQISDAAQMQIQARTRQYQRDLGDIVSADVRNSRGIR